MNGNTKAVFFGLNGWGGWFAGLYAFASLAGFAFAAVTGPDWYNVSPAAEWSVRNSAAAVVHNNKVWILSGVSRESGISRRRNDVWSSGNGVNWNKIVAEVPWPGRNEHAAVSFGSRIWVLGG